MTRENLLALLTKFAPLAPYWTLHGGGCLAYHLGHRMVTELDFFRELPAWKSEAAALTVNTIISPQWPNATEHRQHAQQSFDNNQGVFKLRLGELTLSFVNQPKVSRSLHRIQSGNHLPVASLEDIVGVKLFVLLDRRAVIDYIDWAAILANGWTPAQIIEAGRKIATVRNGNCDIKRALQLLVEFPAEADALLTSVQKTQMRDTSQQALALIDQEKAA